jgi:hypothetical protein
VKQKSKLSFTEYHGGDTEFHRVFYFSSLF